MLTSPQVRWSMKNKSLGVRRIRSESKGEIMVSMRDDSARVLPARFEQHTYAEVLVKLSQCILRVR